MVLTLNLTVTVTLTLTLIGVSEDMVCCNSLGLFGAMWVNKLTSDRNSFDSASEQISRNPASLG